MTPGIAVCFSLIIIVLTAIIIRLQATLAVVTRNQQRLVFYFTMLTKKLCPEELDRFIKASGDRKDEA